MVFNHSAFLRNVSYLMSITSPIPSQKEMEQLSARGRAIYNQTLKSTLEPLRNGQVVAIRLDSGDYEAARNSPTASRALCARHPVGLTMVTDVGPAKIDSLTLRMLGSQLLSGDSKSCSARSETTTHA